MYITSLWPLLMIFTTSLVWESLYHRSFRFPNFDSIHWKYSQKCFYAGWRGLQCKYNRMKCPCVHKYRSSPLIWVEEKHIWDCTNCKLYVLSLYCTVVKILPLNLHNYCYLPLFYNKVACLSFPFCVQQTVVFLFIYRKKLYKPFLLKLKCQDQIIIFIIFIFWGLLPENWFN